MIIRLQDCRQVFYCSRGIRAFCAKYNLDYSSFIKDGIDESVLAALNDSMATKVIEAAHGRK